eukprot:TRINITY_DN17111_c0_g1_i1.p1 TRINITY_DN17111_c0_g1~~TRINITY_DN17111_c0_g1_i1.p1  ORF type:complete len:412 (-),score=55.49 TRINITY_DN17111_c0_g1_i1:185-1420(-)
MGKRRRRSIGYVFILVIVVVLLTVRLMMLPDFNRPVVPVVPPTATQETPPQTPPKSTPPPPTQQPQLTKSDTTQPPQTPPKTNIQEQNIATEEEQPQHKQPTAEAKKSNPNAVNGMDYAFSLANANKTLLIIPVNGGWHDLGVNLWCSLQKATQGKRKEMTFLAFDHQAYNSLSALNLPVYMDPQIKERSADRQQWGATDFNLIVCSKISGVLHLLQNGYNVILVDADVAVFIDPFLDIPWQFDMTWSWGGHFDPLGPKPGGAKLPAPSCKTSFTGGRCYVNTGWYHAQPVKSTIEFFKRAEALCEAQGPTKLGDRDDQTYVNELLVAEMDGQKKRPDGKPYADYKLGCYNPCRYTNGNTFFKHHVRQKYDKNQIVSVHANFMTGGSKKIKKFQESGIWDTTCVKGFKPKK